MSGFKRRSGKVAPQLPLTVLVLGLAAAGIFIWWKDERGDPAHLFVSGTIEGEAVRVGSKVGGRLATVEVIEGEHVAPGQQLASFDIPELQAQRAQLLASRAEGQAALDKLRNGPRRQDLQQAKAYVDSARANYAEVAAGTRSEDIASAKAAWQQAEVNYNLAAADLRRVQELFNQGVTPRNQLDAAEARAAAARQAAESAKEQYEKAQRGPRDTQLDAAAAQVKVAEAGYEIVRAGSRPEDISAGESRIANVDAQLAQLDVRLAEAVVSAPADGIVSTVINQPGDLIQPNMAILELLLDDTYYVQVFIPENKLSWAQPGTSASIAIDSYPGERFTGTVTYLAARGEFTPRNLQTKEKRVEEVFRCKLKLDNAGGKLRPGMVCDVSFDRPQHGGST